VFPYLWIYTNGTIQNGIELKSSSGTSFTASGEGFSVATNSHGDVYIVGYGSLGSSRPYLWIYTNGTIQNGIELKSSSGTSFTTNGEGWSVAANSHGDVYIVGFGSSGVQHPYLWIYTNGFIENGIELKSSSGTSFTASSQALDVAIISNGDVYIVGYGNSGVQTPYLWIYTNGFIQNGMELKSSSGTSFTSSSQALSVSVYNTLLPIDNLLSSVNRFSNTSFIKGIKQNTKNSSNTLSTKYIYDLAPIFSPFLNRSSS